MATVVITFFLKIFHVYKMDADFDQRRRSRISISLRENRWSMNSQRLEEIVAELMKPISDLRRSFDTDLSALLEEYLTEAGLHALEAEEGGGSADNAPNYLELALLVQQCASIYSRKVDFLYQHVLILCDSLDSTLEISQAGGEEGQGAEEAATPSGSRRKRKASVSGDFAAIEPEPCAAARRQAAPRPPPVLPRVYAELEPRVLGAADAVATDYAGDAIGVLADFHVCWRLQEGLLVEELCSGASPARSAPLTLLQLQAAMPPPAPLPPPPGTPPPASPPPSPLPWSPPPPASTPLPATTTELKPPAKQRKRKNDTSIEDILDGNMKFSIGKELRRKLKKSNEFSIPEQWIRAVVKTRSQQILKGRARLRKLTSKFIDFHGFDSTDIGGFCGWSESEAAADSSLVSALSRVTSALSAAAVSAVTAVSARRERDDSDDDGFFEQSSLGDSDAGRIDDSGIASLHASAADWADSAAWAARVASQAERAAPCSVPELAARVLTAATTASHCAVPWTRVLSAAEQPHDVSRLFLATLFLANSGNVHIERGAALSVDTFAVRVLSDDPSLYSAAAQPAFQAQA